MHIVLVLAGSELTDRDARLVQALAELAHVDRVTLCATAMRDGLVVAAERWRARVERLVARMIVPSVDAATLASERIHVEVFTQSECEPAVAALRADWIVNLRGAPLNAMCYAECDVFELWWDGVQPENLGAMRAQAKPPRDIAVTVSRRGTYAPQLLERSRLTRTRGTEAADRRNASSRSLVLLRRALRSADIAAGEPWPAAAGARNSAVHLVATVSVMFGTVASAVWRRASRVLWRGDAWELQYRTNTQQFVNRAPTVTADGFRSYRAPYDCFYADPIVFRHDGMDAVFMEEYPHRLGRGVISYALLQPDGTLSQPQRILERRYHLSYPFVFRDGETVYMIPETSANRSVELYRCAHFPNEWVLERTLLDNIAVADATVHFDGTRWWMFATVGEEGSYAWDELHLFMADAPTGEWTPHPGNPVKRDARSARPAGPLFWKDGRLIRPTQDCSETYGGAVTLCEVEVLTVTEFREKEVGRVSPELFTGMNGLHTLAATDRLEVVDVRPRRRTRWSK